MNHSFLPAAAKSQYRCHRIRPHMTEVLATLFREKSVEFETPIQKRVYCANPSCSAFLGKQVSVARLLTCSASRCGSKTCLGCKQLVQKSLQHVCKLLQEEADDVFMTLVNRQGWAYCPGCRVPVERTAGCDHMTCRCKTEFCYKCKEKWRKCECGIVRRPPRRRRPRRTLPVAPETTPIPLPVVPSRVVQGTPSRSYDLLPQLLHS
ncbi:hypothetical protein OE88DRAFT_764952 [Heliocybe sulcata]|uniref:RBR-type E3 ubiquitin transferase n=1 Tax=Heliocybe sulcata TaxID=5364 RepID=A0A5C3MRI6_9AGAM|nr:hypothetical protein OE88DRAFT_764952 [Heliocybe sulcata]